MVLGASLEVRRAIVFATFIVTLVFLPVLTLTGLQGSFFAPLALSYILAIMASLVVALTLTPALAYLLFDKGVQNPTEPKLQHWLKNGYVGLLGFVARWPRAIIGVVALICILAASRLASLSGGELLPAFREGHFVLQVQAVPGTSLPEMLRLGGEITKQLKAKTDIATVELAGGPGGTGRRHLGTEPLRVSRGIERMTFPARGRKN